MATRPEWLGKLHHLPNVTEFFAALAYRCLRRWQSLSLASNSWRIFLAFGLFSRITSLVLTVNLTMAYVLGDREALLSFFSDPDKFIAAAPFAFLIVSLIVLIFGAAEFGGHRADIFLWLDTVKQANSVTA